MMARIDHDSPLPLHFQAEQALREFCHDLEFRTGKRIPPETELALHWGISRHTIRTAMNRLVNEGLLIRKKGVGTVVNAMTIETRLSEWTSFTREMGQLGMELELMEKNTRTIEADPETCIALGIRDATPVTSLERLKGHGGQAVVLFKSFFHPRLGIPDTELFDGPLYTLLEEKYHVRPAISDEKIGVLAPDAPLRRRLGAPRSVPILYRKRRVSDESGKPVEYGLACYRSDRFEYSIRIKRDDAPYKENQANE